MPGSKIAKPALPLALAMYIATSALRTMSAALSSASRALAMPMLAVTETCCSPMRYGDAELADEPLGHRARALEVGQRRRSGSRTRRRPAGRRGRPRGPSRQIRSVTATSSASPAAWPSVSLTTLKSSRSMNRTAVTGSRRIAARLRRERPARAIAGTSGGSRRRSASRARRGPGRAAAGRRCAGSARRSARAGRAPRRPAARRRRRRSRPVLDDDRAERPAVGEHRRRRAGCGRRAGASARSGLRSGSRRLTGSSSRALPGAADDRVGVGSASSARRRRRATRGRRRRPSRRAEDEAALEAEPLGEAVEDDLRLADRVGDVVELGRRRRRATARSARRWRSSRSFIAEKIDVARANSQNEVTLRTGIRSNSIAAAGHDVDRRRAAGRPGRRARRTAAASATARPSGRSGTRPAARPRRDGGRRGSGSGSGSPPVAYIAKARYRPSTSSMALSSGVAAAAEPATSQRLGAQAGRAT